MAGGRRHRNLSVVTAVHPHRAVHLGEAYESLAAQHLPPGWTWEWLLQEDGAPTTSKHSLPDDPRIHHATNGRPLGTSTTRTLAAARAHGELVKVLDADDVLTPGALAREIAVFEEHADVGWTTAAVEDLVPGESPVGWHDDPAEGPIGRGTVFDYWMTHDFRPQIHPVTLCMRADALWTAGGWMALPVSEDTGLLMALSTWWKGYFVSSPGLRYRKWPQQTTATMEWEPPGTRQARRSAIIRRVRAMERTTSGSGATARTRGAPEIARSSSPASRHPD